MLRSIVAGGVLALVAWPLAGQNREEPRTITLPDGSVLEVIEDEAEVPPYALPDPLVTSQGVRVTEASQWPSRRSEILELFRNEVYGRDPDDVPELIVEEVQEGLALGGRAQRWQVRARFAGPDSPLTEILLYLPARQEKPVPVFLSLNFSGNHTISPDPGIWLPTVWEREEEGTDPTPHPASEESRGSVAGRWPVGLILERGYGVATIYTGDIDPDFDDGFRNGVHPHLLAEGEARTPQHGGSIATWAWGLSRTLDVLERQPGIDSSRVAVLGFSRLGKTALWAGAQDERFALVISNDSGCGGAALSRRRFGETVRAINARFPHWFAKSFHRYDDREDELPVDQHMALALVAPRPVYVASASEDLWADPRGEYLSLVAAGSVYRLLGKEELPEGDLPAPGATFQGDVGHHLREGGHDLTEWDWERFIDFADRHLRN